MAEGRKSWVRSAVLCSLCAPLVAGGFGALSSGLQTGIAKIVVGGVGTTVILAGFILGIAALAGSLRQGCKGAAGLAAAGLGVNALLLLGFVMLIPALAKVARVRNAGYTLVQMQAMPRVIPGSREVLNEALGFRLEVPGDFTDNPQPQPPQVLYSFVHADGNEVDLCLNVERLGGRIAIGPVGPEFYEGMRSRMPPDGQVDQAIMPWKSHQLDAFRMQFSTRGRLVCVWGVQVPLAREAIQVLVCGRPDASEECRRLLEQLLTGLAGLSNWDPPSLRMVSAPSRWPGPSLSRAAESAPPTDSR